MKRLTGDCYLEVDQGVKIYYWDFKASIESGYNCEPFLETFNSESLAIQRERRFPEDSQADNPPLYVNKNLPTYGFAIAEKLPHIEATDSLVIDLGW